MHLKYKPRRGMSRQTSEACPTQASLPTAGRTYLFWDSCRSAHWTIKPHIAQRPENEAFQRDVAADLKSLLQSGRAGYSRQHTPLIEVL